MSPIVIEIDNKKYLVSNELRDYVLLLTNKKK